MWSNLVATFAQRKAYLLLLAVVLLCFPPRGFFKLSTDDYMAIHYQGGATQLEQMGILPDSSQQSFWQRLNNTFHFFSAEQGTLASLKSYGALPWWMPDDASMHMLRPIASFTHWIDARFFPGNFTWAQVHGLFWYMLMAVSVFTLFRHFLGAGTAAFFAALLYILDGSQLFNFYWLAARNSFMAPIFACWCILLFAWHAEGRGFWCLLLSLLSLVLALFTAEAGLAACAYLFAYVVCLDPRGYKKGILYLLPFAALVVAWRLYYNQAGFGSHHIGLYVDPLDAPLAFIESLLGNYVILAFSMISSLDSSLPNLDPGAATALRIVATVVVLACVALVWPLLRQQRRLAFFFIGSLLSLIPFCALTFNNPRSLFMSAIGFFPVVAVWALHLWHSDVSGFKKYLVRPVLPVIAGLLVVFPMIVSATMYTPFPLLTIEKGEMPAEMSGGAPIENPNGAVYVSYPYGFSIFLPYTWETLGQPIPKKIYQLVPGINSFTFQREAENQFLLISDAQFVLHHRVALHSKDAKRHAIDPLNGVAATQSMTASPSQRYHVGDQFEVGNMRITVVDVIDAIPSKLRFQFINGVDPEQLDWRRYDWPSKEFLPFALPAIGDSVYVPNAWDVAP